MVFRRGHGDEGRRRVLQYRRSQGQHDHHRRRARVSSEVEEAVGSHECVFDCAVVGVPDEKWGEKVAAVVITRPGVDPASISEKDIMECCRKS